MSALHLPIVPTSVLRRHHVHRPLDHRFRAAARLLQSLWRINQGLPMGTYTTPAGTKYRLGSRIAGRAASAGANFINLDVARLASREVAYREPGAFIDEERLWTNLLSSTGLTFNVFGPLRLDLHLATRVIRGLCPELTDVTARAVLFEHSPARHDESLTGDGTAWDAFIAYSRPNGAQGFIAFEVKYAEALHQPRRGISARLADLAARFALYREPEARPLTAGPLQQMLREHVLAQALLDWGHFSEGRFIMVAPALNRPVQRSIDAYRRQLLTGEEGKVRLDSWTLEDLVDQIRLADRADYAERLHRRYLDWEAVDDALEAAFAIAGRARKATDDPVSAAREATR